MKRETFCVELRCVTYVTGSLLPVRAMEVEATSVPPVSLATQASTANGNVGLPPDVF